MERPTSSSSGHAQLVFLVEKSIARTPGDSASSEVQQKIDKVRLICLRILSYFAHFKCFQRLKWSYKFYSSRSLPDLKTHPLDVFNFHSVEAFEKELTEVLLKESEVCYSPMKSRSYAGKCKKPTSKKPVRKKVLVDFEDVTDQSPAAFLARVLNCVNQEFNWNDVDVEASMSPLRTSAMKEDNRYVFCLMKIPRSQQELNEFVTKRKADLGLECTDSTDLLSQIFTSQHARSSWINKQLKLYWVDLDLSMADKNSSGAVNLCSQAMCEIGGGLLAGEPLVNDTLHSPDPSGSLLSYEYLLSSALNHKPVHQVHTPVMAKLTLSSSRNLVVDINLHTNSSTSRTMFLDGCDITVLGATAKDTVHNAWLKLSSVCLCSPTNHVSMFSDFMRTLLSKNQIMIVQVHPDGSRYQFVCVLQPTTYLSASIAPVLPESVTPEQLLSTSSSEELHTFINKQAKALRSLPKQQLLSISRPELHTFIDKQGERPPQSQPESAASVTISPFSANMMTSGIYQTISLSERLLQLLSQQGTTLKPPVIMPKLQDYYRKQALPATPLKNKPAVKEVLNATSEQQKMEECKRLKVNMKLAQDPRFRRSTSMLEKGLEANSRNMMKSAQREAQKPAKPTSKKPHLKTVGNIEFHSTTELACHAKECYQKSLQGEADIETVQSIVGTSWHYFQKAEGSVSDTKEFLQEALYLTNSQVRSKYASGNSSSSGPPNEMRLRECQLQVVLRMEAESLSDHTSPDSAHSPGPEHSLHEERMESLAIEIAGFLTTMSIVNTSLIQKYLRDVLLANYAQTNARLLSYVYLELGQPLPQSLGMTSSPEKTPLPKIQAPLSSSSMSSLLSPLDAPRSQRVANRKRNKRPETSRKIVVPSVMVTKSENKSLQQPRKSVPLVRKKSSAEFIAQSVRTPKKKKVYRKDGSDASSEDYVVTETPTKDWGKGFTQTAGKLPQPHSISSRFYQPLDHCRWDSKFKPTPSAASLHLMGSVTPRRRTRLLFKEIAGSLSPEPSRLDGLSSPIKTPKNQSSSSRFLSPSRSTSQYISPSTHGLGSPKYATLVKDTPSPAIQRCRSAESPRRMRKRLTFNSPYKKSRLQHERMVESHPSKPELKTTSEEIRSSSMASTPSKAKRPHILVTDTQDEQVVETTGVTSLSCTISNTSNKNSSNPQTVLRSPCMGTTPSSQRWKRKSSYKRRSSAKWNAARTPSPSSDKGNVSTTPCFGSAATSTDPITKELSGTKQQSTSFGTSSNDSGYISGLISNNVAAQFITKDTAVTTEKEKSLQKGVTWDAAVVNRDLIETTPKMRIIKNRFNVSASKQSPGVDPPIRGTPSPSISGASLHQLMNSPISTEAVKNSRKRKNM